MFLVSRIFTNGNVRAYVTSSVRSVTSTAYHQSENYRQRLLLATAYRSLDSYGLNEGICNHLSALAPARSDSNKSVMLIIPYGLLWSQVTPDNLVGLNEANQVVEGEGEPEVSARCIHRGVYQARKDVKAVMHTHMPYATALACLKDPKLLMVHQNSARFLNRVAYDFDYGGVVTAMDEGQRLGKVIHDKDVLLMGHHGVMTVGHSISVAFDHMYYFERACTFQVLALSTGLPVAEMPLEVGKQTEKAFWDVIDETSDAHLEAKLKEVAKNDPDFRHQHE